MKRITFILYVISLLMCGSNYAISSDIEQERTFEILFKFTPPDNLTDHLQGYKLFKGSSEVCNVPINEIYVSQEDPQGSMLNCSFLTEDGTFDFTLSAVYDDGSSSALSPPFSYTISSPPTQNGANKLITYSWENIPEEVEALRMYMNDTMLCEISAPGATDLSCKADLINEVMKFFITSVDINGEESEKSNILTLDPADFDKISSKKRLVLDISYDKNHDGGFNVYNNDQLICSTADSLATKIECEIDALYQTNVFTIKAVDTEGKESIASNTIVYSQDTTSPSEAQKHLYQPTLAAQISTSATYGQAPFTVQFDGSDSSGNIESYTWDFGDGTTGNGRAVNHTYSTPGAFKTILTITGYDSVTSKEEITVSVLPKDETSIAPTAVLSAMPSVGNVPLRVTFDATESNTINAPIVSYTIDYGDGSSGDDSITEHVYSSPGTYNAQLTITDSAALTDSVNIPILVTGTAPANQQPSAAMLLSPISGTCPLTVYADGSSSSDADGNISTYKWDLGDGTSSVSQSIQHTYNTPASYKISLTVTDNSGSMNTVSKTISCSETPKDIPFKIEVGEINLTHEWIAVDFNKPFNSPVVIAGAPTYHESQPAVVRIRNITPEGFEIRLEEWEYLDGKHIEELISYVAIEQGQTTLSDGSKLEAGFFPATTAPSSISFQQLFLSKPVVLTTISSVNDQSTITGRISAVTTSKFNYRLKEEEAADQEHKQETIGYIAWEPGSGLENGISYEVGLTTNSIKDVWTKIDYQKQFSSMPFFFTYLQTENVRDTAALRQKKLGVSSVQIKVEEEQSKDNETVHSREVAGYFIIGSDNGSSSSSQLDQEESNATLKRITFKWKYDGDETSIKGFKFYMNGTFICETSDPTLRETSCDVALIDNEMNFGITSVNLDDTESDSSVLFTLDGKTMEMSKSVTFHWTFPTELEPEVSKFNIYNNNILVCQAEPNERTKTCKTVVTGNDNFYITSIGTGNVESISSNVIAGN